MISYRERDREWIDKLLDLLWKSFGRERFLRSFITISFNKICNAKPKWFDWSQNALPILGL